METDYRVIELKIKNMPIDELQAYMVTLSNDMSRLKTILCICEDWLNLKRRVRDINNGGPKT